MKISFRLSIALLLGAISISACTNLPPGKAAYESGKYAEAMRELKPAAEAGDPEAQTLVGNMYVKGSDVEKNDAEAFSWFSKAAVHGNREAKLALSDMYRNGIGVDKDSALSAYWRFKAAYAPTAPEVQQLESEIESLRQERKKDITFKQIWVHLKDANGKVTCVPPEYPKAAEKAHMQGTAKIALVVGADGEVKDAIILQSTGWPILDEATLSSFKTCQYSPATRSGKAITSIDSIRYVWKLD